MRGRPSGEKVRCSGEWTEARFNSFIKSMLRAGTVRWKPIQDVRKKARVRRGWYLCAGCGEEVPTSKKDENRVSKKNTFVDHIQPIVDPDLGFVSWDEVVNRMFCEEDNLQLLCADCHNIKSKEETERHKQRRAREKLNDPKEV